MIKNLNYELTGSGQTAIVFLHGWGLSGEYFNKVIDKLTMPCKILKLDFFSFGLSEMPESYFDTYEFAYYIYLLINELNLKKIMLVGHSFGGRIAVILSSVFDVNIVACVLTSSAGINRYSIIKKVKILKYKFLKFLVRKSLISNCVLDRYGSADFKQLSDNIMRKIFIRIVNQDLRFLLHKIKCHVALVWDRKDDVTPYWICKFLSKRLINQSIFLFDYGKHFAYLHNIDKFANIVVDTYNYGLSDTKYNVADINI